MWLSDIPDFSCVNYKILAVLQNLVYLIYQYRSHFFLYDSFQSN